MTQKGTVVKGVVKVVSDMRCWDDGNAEEIVRVDRVRGGGYLRGGSIYSASYVMDPGYVTSEPHIHIYAGNVVSLPGAAYGRARSIVGAQVRGCGGRR